MFTDIPRGIVISCVVVPPSAPFSSMDVAVITLPIIREENGLAMSSRNSYLNKTERKKATVLYHALKTAESEIQNGERLTEYIKNVILSVIKSEPALRIEYIEIRNAKNLTVLDVLKGRVLIALAANLGKTRLIDNIILDI